MVVFACSGCGTVLTAPVSRVALPVHAHQMHGREQLLGVLLRSGTYAVDPDPIGPPWRRWAEIGADEARARGWYAPAHVLSCGPRGAVVVAPGDVRGTVAIPDRLGGHCCGLDGQDGPNLACAGCGRPVATRIDDCSLWQATWLDPREVQGITDGDAPRQELGWQELGDEWPGIPPVEPAGWWSPQWEAAVAAALAHLLAVSDGSRVDVPGGGLLADAFGRSLEVLLPPRPTARAMALAGPGLPGVAADIALVPRHPQTGECWAPSRAVDVVPLDYEVWTYLASHRRRTPVPRSGAVPDHVRRDAPPPLMPFHPLQPDQAVFLSTLARLPEVRRPWLRAIYDQVRAGRSYL